MRKRKRTGLFRSIYARTAVQLSISILLVFAVLAVVFIVLFARLNEATQTEQLIRNASAVAEIVSGGMNPTRTQIDSASVPGYLAFTARSTQALVWLVNAEGDIIYQNGIPAETIQNLERKKGGAYYSLPVKWRNNTNYFASGRSRSGNYAGLMPGDELWLTASTPLYSVTGAYGGEILIHRTLRLDNFSTYLLNNSIMISFISAFAIALVIILLFSRNLTRPISNLAAVANRVYQGDWSARARLRPGTDAPMLMTDGGDVKHWDDLTLLVRTMNTLIAKMESEEKDRSDFMSSIAHDLRTPLTSIKGFVTGMLDDTITKDQWTQYLSIVQQEVLRLQKLVDSLFEVSLSTRPKVFQKKVFDVHRLIREDIIGLERQLTAKQIDVQVNFSELEGETLPVLGDREAINRVIYNILVNAANHTPEGGVILVTTSVGPTDEDVEVIIEDSGPGILARDLPHIFDRFYKADKSRHSPGSGLGLFIARSILQAHGQRISAGDSHLGGARITFTLARPGAGI